MAINSILPKVVNTGADILKNEFDPGKDIEIIIYDQFRDGLMLKPILTGDVQLTYEWLGAPGRLDFEVFLMEDKPGKGINYILEGNQVLFRYKNSDIFLGYVFIRKMDNSKNTMKITAYDQLRYLKNKWFYKFENVTASDIIKRIAADYKLKLGDIADTEYLFESRTEDDKTLFDIILNVLSITTQMTKKKYVLYDDCGSLTLADQETMKIPDLIIDENSGEEYSYSSTIDKDTYNNVVIYYKNDKTGKREIYNEKDSVNIRRWGYLTLLESAPEGVNKVEKAVKMLELHNYPRRTYSLSKVFGDLRVYGGSGVLVKMQMAEMNILNYMIVTTVRHTFKHGEYFMDLSLISGISRKDEMNLGRNESAPTPPGGIS